MSAPAALKAAQEADITISLNSEKLTLSAATQLPDVVLHLLAAHKAEFLAWLRPGANNWSP